MNIKRVNKFHGNIPAWLYLAEIDYYTQFVKAWIPFNAWFSTTYSSENQDRDIINKIKHEINPFRDKIINYLTRRDVDSLDFNRLIGKLHLELDANAIPSHESRITFRSVIISKNTLPSNSVNVKGFNVKVTYNHSAPKGTQKVNTKVIELRGLQPKMDWSQNDWDIDSLKEHRDFLRIATEKLRIEVQNGILECYNQLNPYKPTCLVIDAKRVSKNNPQLTAPSNCITIDPIKHVYFINEPETIAKGLIEILYSLRNALFHGEINPSPEVQKIYKEGYYILNTLIKAL